MREPRVRADGACWVLAPFVVNEPLGPGPRWPPVQEPGAPVRGEPSGGSPTQLVRATIANVRRFIGRHAQAMARDLINLLPRFHQAHLARRHEGIHQGRQRAVGPSVDL